MKGSTARTAWIVAPPEVCVLCKEPLGSAAETSYWNGRPAHRECVRVHLIQRDPAFREWGSEESSPDPGSDAPDDIVPREDDDEEPG